MSCLIPFVLCRGTYESYTVAELKELGQTAARKLCATYECPNVAQKKGLCKRHAKEAGLMGGAAGAAYTLMGGKASVPAQSKAEKARGFAAKVVITLISDGTAVLDGVVQAAGAIHFHAHLLMHTCFVSFFLLLLLLFFLGGRLGISLMPNSSVDGCTFDVLGHPCSSASDDRHCTHSLLDTRSLLRALLLTVNVFIVLFIVHFPTFPRTHIWTTKVTSTLSHRKTKRWFSCRAGTIVTTLSRANLLGKL